jgi:hypothetical protein
LRIALLDDQVPILLGTTVRLAALGREREADLSARAVVVVDQQGETEATAPPQVRSGKALRAREDEFANGLAGPPRGRDLDVGVEEAFGLVGLALAVPFGPLLEPGAEEEGRFRERGYGLRGARSGFTTEPGTRQSLPGASAPG